MKSFVRTISIALLCLATQVMADAPVVDDSENFALLEEQVQAAEELPVAHDAYTITDDSAEPALAQDNAHGDTTRNTDLVNKIIALQKEIQDLRGQLEIQAHELNELKQQQLSFYQDLANQLNPAAAETAQKKLAHPSLTPTNTIDEQNASNAETPNSTESNALIEAKQAIQPVPSIEPQSVVKASTNPAEEQISYLAAYDLIKQKQYPQATSAMQQFLSKYPHSGYSANAHYWLGELYLAKKEYDNAITQFDTVIHEFKSSSKYAPSKLKLGYALAGTGRIGEAKEQLLAVMNKYPDTSAAHLAQMKLKALGG
ncbi:MAG TPA: tol-pal system protein YbgF [Legionellaceae bacterium]|nr:tol-pal system protein YbgF [Legionellaceae bacterium]